MQTCRQPFPIPARLFQMSACRCTVAQAIVRYSLIPPECRPEQIEVRRLPFLEINRENIESHGHIPRIPISIRQLPQIMPREPAQVSPLIVIDGSLGSRDSSRRSRLYLDETQRVAFPGDQVQIPANNTRPPSPRDHDESPAPQIEVTRTLTPAPGRKMRSIIPPPRSGPLAGIHQRFKQIQLRRLDPSHPNHCAGC